jgi:hypothetical protein
MQNSKPPAKKRSWTVYVGVGCGLLLLLTCCTSAAVGAYFYLRPQAGSEPAVEYVLDASPRMNASTEGGTRIEVARGVLAEIVRPANPDLSSGLRVFGSGAVAQPCQDTALVVPFATSNQDKIASRLGGVEAGSNSNSDLSEAMISAIRDLRARGGPHSLVVVTGGADACNPQAGELIAQEAQRAGVDLKTYVVGFQVSADDSQALKNQVGSIPGGELQTADDEAGLRTVLSSIQRKVDATAGSQASGQTACDHPYLPLRAGASWTYAGSDAYSWTVDSVSGDQQSATAHMTMNISNGSFAMDWNCSPDGILYYSLGSFSSADIPGVVTFQVSSANGVTLPKESILTSGGSWDNSYTISLGVNVPGLGDTFNTQTSEHSTAGPPMSYTTPAGTFDVIPVTSQGTVSTTGLGGFSSDLTTTIYYAKDIGVVHIESSAAGISVTYDLQSYSVP